MSTICTKHRCEMPAFRVIDGYEIVRCPKCVEEARRMVDQAIENGLPGAYRRKPLFAGLK